MCGINGILRLCPEAPPLALDELRRTRDAMTRRGPDGSGEWLSPDGLLALGHRRLAIIDLSPTGAQPMTSCDGRHVLVFNGEIYNYRELRAELAAQGAKLRTESDSEVILELFAQEGRAALSRLRGMYALAIWDGTERRLTLARDPYGIKPLYYASDGRTLRFASQVRALEAGGGVSREISPAGVVGFYLWGSVPEPHTLRREVRAVPAGSTLEIVGGAVGEPLPLPEPKRREERPDIAKSLDDSVRAHLVSDVPVGVFLSAGLDSALIAALARRASPEPLQTFTLAFAPFAGTAQDEAPLAAEIARALGTRHLERRVDPDEFRRLWDEHLDAMDQPSIDGFNTYLVSKLAHEAGLKVALSGLGGDELFGSYPSFRDVPRWNAFARAAAKLPGAASAWSGLARSSSRPKLRGLLRYGESLPGAYFLRRGLFLPEELPALLGDDLAREGLAAYDPIADAARALGDSAARDPWLAVHHLESAMYLRNQLLRDSDWASLAHSLELRVPLVDDRLRRELAALNFEPARSRGKAEVVRRAAPELPAAVFARRKSGFAVPVGEWIGPVNDANAPRMPKIRRLSRAVGEAFGVGAA